MFLDFRDNPRNQEIEFDKLYEETREYLEKADATFGTPYERLLHMNKPAIDFYRDRGVDLKTESLEIALCAQHNNGGLSIDAWWQTNIEGIFAVGEVSGSHGIYRPGGSALNSGQVGATRAAQFIAANRKGNPADIEELVDNVSDEIIEIIKIGENCVTTEDNIDSMWDHVTKRMSQVGAAIREVETIKKAAEEIRTELKEFNSIIKIVDSKKLKKVYRLYVYLSAMIDYINNEGKSRGSALYTDRTGHLPYDFLPEIFTYSLDDGSNNDMVQEVSYEGNECRFTWRKVREIPREENFFETVWRDYRENKNIY